MILKFRTTRMSWVGLVTLLVYLALPVAATAQTPSTTATWNLPALNGGTTVRLEGYEPKTALNLILPAGWQPSTEGRISLDYRLSDLVVEGATLTVRLNDQPIDSVNFESEAGLIAIDIPAGFFFPGENILELAAYLPLEEDLACIVPNHPGRWLEFGPDSFLSMELEPTENPLMLAGFPAQFEALGDDSAALITFVIPDAPSRDELNALSAVGFALAQGIKTAPQWQNVPADEFGSEPASGPVILVAKNGNIPYLDSLMPPNGAEAGWLSLTRPDWSAGYPVLAVGGPDGGAVLRAAQSLADPRAVAQMGTEVAIVDTLPVSEPFSLEEQFTMADLGYGERVVRGTGERSLIYSFDIPFAWSPQDGKLELNFAHSANLNPQIATLTVLLNSHIAVGLNLNAPEFATNAVEVPIPKELIRPGRNFLRLAFDFGPPVESCEYSSGQQSWASVRPETTLTLPHGYQGGRLDLKDYPFTFASEADTAELSIVLPENMTHYDLTQALDLVRNLSIKGNRFAPRFVQAADFDAGAKTEHFIVVGLSDRQAPFSELESYLPISFENNWLSAYGIRLPNDAPDLGVVQAFRSPWAENRVILVASGKTKAGYDQAMQLLIDPLLQAELEDQLVFAWPGSEMDSPQVYTERLPDLAAVPGVGFIDRLFGQTFEPSSPWPIIILVCVVMVVLAMVSVFVPKWMRHRQAAQ